MILSVSNQAGDRDPEKKTIWLKDYEKQCKLVTLIDRKVKVYQVFSDLRFRRAHLRKATAITNIFNYFIRNFCYVRDYLKLRYA